MEPTYKTGTDADGDRWIECSICGYRSYHPNDIEQRYCGHCHIFHEDQQEA